MARNSDKDKIEISHYILEHVPREAEVTRIEYEGPALAVYTKKPEFWWTKAHKWQKSSA